MTDQEQKAMQMALDALESCEFDYDWEERPYKTFDEDLVNDAVDALRKALAQPEQEPVAWLSSPNFIEQETVEGKPRRVWFECNAGVGIPFYTAPPSKPFVFLTKEDMSSGDHPMYDTKEFYAGMAWAQTKLKEKNT